MDMFKRRFLEELPSKSNCFARAGVLATLEGTFEPTQVLYHEDAYMKEFTAKVLVSQEIGGQFKIVLDRTAFYPLGGGQPPDNGILRGGDGEAVVKDVRMDHGVVVHVAEVKGAIREGETVAGVIDWSRRYSLMRNHTLAHLMAEAIRKATGSPAEVVSSGLDLDKARLDLSFEGSLSLFFEEIQKVASDVIKENRSVTARIMRRDEAESYVARFHESLKTLPPQVQSVRVVEVKDWHACACGGTHVKATGEIGGVEILRRMSKGKGVERIEFRAQTS
jgi:alanyl-tRNA synthetase